MSFGLRTWGAGGTLELDTDTFTYQIIFNQVYQMTPSSVFNVSIPEFKVANCVAILLPTGVVTGSNPDTNVMPFQSVSDGLVTVSTYHPLDTSSYSTIQVRLIVMRYKN